MFQSLALLSLTLLSSQHSKAFTNAFTLASSSPQKLRKNLSLGATVEKTALISPDSIPSDDIPALFEDYVQKTYG
jgi:hypothetical protein